MDAGATTAADKAAASGAETEDVPSSQLTATPEPVPKQEKPLPVPAAAADPARSMAVTSTNIAESGAEDEEVERFYELLANIRAMRGMYARGNGGTGARARTHDDIASEVCGGVRKRARWAEQPWRPAFRMEDFQDREAPGGSAPKDRSDDGTATSPRQGKETKDEAADGEGDD